MQGYSSRIELRHLRYYVAIVQKGSFRAAAEELNISQPPLTRQMQQLEEILGTPLLLRKTSGVQTTEAGEEFYTEATNILSLVERAYTNTRLIGTGQMGRLDVGVFGSAVLDIIPRTVLHFCERFPDVKVALHNMDRETQVKALGERRIQIGFNRFFQDYPDLVWEHVAHERSLVAVPANHPIASKAEVSFYDLADEPLIFYPGTSKPGGFSNYLARKFHSLGIEPRVVQSVDDVVTAVAFVSSGFGLTICVESSKSLRLPGVAYVPLTGSDDGSLDLSVIYRAAEKSQLVEAFLESLRAVSASDEGAETK